MQRCSRSALLLIFLVFPASCTQTKVPADPYAPPPGALVLFDGQDFSHWTGVDGGPVQWKIVDSAMEVDSTMEADRAMEVVPGSGSIITKQVFQSFLLHLEFNVPITSTGVEGQNSGNSGVYLLRRYEIQILDSFGETSGKTGCGALYRFKAPDQNACGKPGEWQFYDIIFQAPQWGGEGDNLRKILNAIITVKHNGVVIHDKVSLPDKTGRGQPESREPGPILLQDHGNEVKFRNLWILPME